MIRLYPQGMQSVKRICLLCGGRISEHLRYAAETVTDGLKIAMRRVFIQQWREDRGLSVIDLAEKVGVERNAVYNWQNGKRDIPGPKLELLAKALDIEVPDLYKMPGRKSIDAIAADLSDADHQNLLNLATRLAQK